MPTTRSPRKGSLQYWPRKRARKQRARVRYFQSGKEARPLAFAGYKVGMTHILIVDNSPNSITKGQKISVPITVIECPPLKVIGQVFYKKTENGDKKVGNIFAANPDKSLGRAMPLPKKPSNRVPEDFDFIRLLVMTQPKQVGFKKKPEVWELPLGGQKGDQHAKANELMGKDIEAGEVFKEGQQVDLHAVTKGKGYQGPVKRFGVALRAAKSEKGRRGPANLGPWTGNRSWTVAHAGQTGYHLRTEHNKWIIEIGDNPAKINPVGGFLRYGNVTKNYVLLKGSVAGPPKRLITMTLPARPNRKIPNQKPAISHISRASKQ